MSRSKAADEMFCRSCGEPIKKKAAICPECGVSNGAEQAQTTTGHPNPRKTARRQTVTDELFTPDLRQHDPTGYTTTVAGKWHYAVGLSAVLWIGWYLLPAPEILDLTVFIPWALMPLGIYLDRQWVRATTRWDPPLKLWLLGSVLPLVNIFAAGVYLLRRWNVDTVSSPTGGTAQGHDTRDPVERLQDQYSRGELTDDEFDTKMEKLLETEQVDTRPGTHSTRDEKSAQSTEESSNSNNN